MGKKTEWFADWFDSPYYHILYGHRDQSEAEFFLRNLINKYQPKPNASIIDLACGKGRHSIFLNSLGFDVTGVDLSNESIRAANAFANQTLHFEVGDLRSLKSTKSFDFALNLFTSFGYFEDLDTDLQVIQNIHQLLEPEGIFLIDFFNAHKVIQHLVQAETIERQGIQFHISRKVEHGKILKNIAFEHQGNAHQYQELVQALTQKDFENLLNAANFKIIDCFGAYDLSSFNSQSSDRLILIAQKY
jgi:SAM-dependent methyltransferase